MALLDVTDPEHLFPFNSLAERTALAADNLTPAFKAIWHDSWGPRLEWFLHRGISLVLEQYRTLTALPRIYYDKAFRAKLTQKIHHRSLQRLLAARIPFIQRRPPRKCNGADPQQDRAIPRERIDPTMLSYHHAAHCWTSSRLKPSRRRYTGRRDVVVQAARERFCKRRKQ